MRRSAWGSWLPLSAAILLWPSTAWALPGPEVLVPLALGAAQLLAVSATVAARWARTPSVGRTLLVLAAAALVDGLMMRGALGSALPTIVLVGGLVLTAIEPSWLGPRTARGRRAVRYGLALLAALVAIATAEATGPSMLLAAAAVVGLGAIPNPWMRQLVARILLGALAGLLVLSVVKSRPLADSPPFPIDSALAQTDTSRLVVNVGERSDFASFRLAADYRLRPADVADAAVELRSVLAAGKGLLLVVANEIDPEARGRIVELERRGAVVVHNDWSALHTARGERPLLAYEPYGRTFLRLLVPRALLEMHLDAPGLGLEDIPMRRSVDLELDARANGELDERDCGEISAASTGELRGRYADSARGPIVRCASLVQASAAVQALASVGARPPIVRLPGELSARIPSVGATRLSPARLAGVLVLLVVLGLLVDRAVLGAARRAESRYVSGLETRGALRWQLGSLALASLAPAALAALAANHLGLPESWAWLAAPMICEQGPLLVPALVVAVSVGLLVRLDELLPLWRGPALLVASAFVLALCGGIVAGPLPLPIHLAFGSVSLLGPPLLRRFAGRWLDRRTRPDSAIDLLEVTPADSKIGAKARRLGVARRRIRGSVPPGIVVWAKPDPAHNDEAARLVARRFGDVPLIVRSSGAHEDAQEQSMAGQLASVRVERLPAETRVERLGRALATVVASYRAGQAARAALCMPVVVGDSGGVLFTDLGGSGLCFAEEGPGGADGVTSGADRPIRHLFDREGAMVSRLPAEQKRSRLALLQQVVERAERAATDGPRPLRAAPTPMDVEWLARGSVSWIVQIRPVSERQRAEWRRMHGGTRTQEPAAARAAADAVRVVRDLAWPWSSRRPGDTVLRLSHSDALSSPAADDVCRLWVAMWSGGGALGTALRSIGAPEGLVPREALISFDGHIYAVGPAIDQIAAATKLGLGLQAALRRVSLRTMAGRVGVRCMAAFERQPQERTPSAELQRCAAASLTLRLLAPFVDDDMGQPVPPPSEGLRFGEAFGRYARGQDRADFLERFGHHGPFALDPRCPRYLETEPRAGRGSEEQRRRNREAWQTAGLQRPRLMDRRWNDTYRSWLHERMVRQIALLRERQGHWRQPPEPAPPAEATRLGGGKPRDWSLLELRVLAELGVVPDASDGTQRGTWVSGGGPIEGKVVTATSVAAELTAVRAAGADPEPRECVLVLDQPTAEWAASFHRYRAVVAERGGLLSHAAIVAREEGVAALFGASLPSGLGDGERILLRADGRVERTDG